MRQLIILFLLLFPFIGHSQIEWTEFSLHVLSSQLDEKRICIDFPDSTTFDLIEFDRLVEGSVTIKSNDEILLIHNGESINAVQQYPIEFSTHQIWIIFTTNEDFWIRFQLSP